MKIQTIFATAKSMARPAQGQSRATQAGFTMVELLTVLAILGILIAIATPSMTQFIADWRVNSAVNSMARDFRAARAEAIKRSRPVVICRGNAGLTACANGTEWKGGWLMFVDNNFNGTYNSAADELVTKQNTLPGIGTFVQGAAGSFTFLPNGLMRRDANNARFNVQSSLQGGAQALAEKGICISNTGRFRQAKSSGSCTN